LWPNFSCAGTGQQIRQRENRSADEVEDARRNSRRSLVPVAVQQPKNVLPAVNLLVVARNLAGTLAAGSSSQTSHIQ
jgi:hypothetical protein